MIYEIFYCFISPHKIEYFLRIIDKMDECSNCNNKAINWHGVCPDHVPNFQVQSENMIKYEFDPKCLLCDSFVRSFYEFERVDKFGNIINKRIMSTYCNKHSCNVVGCDKPCKYNKIHCTLHKCQVDDCTRMKGCYTNYCDNHKCKFCDKVNINTDIKVCVDHKCGQAECMNDLCCPKHWCLTCESTTCDHSRTYCKKCSDGIPSEEKYCIIHRCCFRGCYEGVSLINKFYCEIHRCRSYDTLKMRETPVTCLRSINCGNELHCAHNKIEIAEYIKVLPRDILGIILTYYIY